MSISEISRRATSVCDVIEHLAQALSETIVVTSKAQSYHWNVTGMSFGPLHTLFQDIYEDHFAAQDDLAERIKALGGHADSRPSVALARSAVTECAGKITPEAMVEQLAGDQRTLSSTLGTVADVANEVGDHASHDLAVARIAVHDKFAWMLQAHVTDRS
jgi:starvation-inducible DNA-binding protein